MASTESEDLFERFCDENAIPWERIPTAAEPTPDYVIQLGASPVVCEIKQIEQSEAERKAWQDSVKPGVSAIFSPPNQLRPKLKNLRQLRAASAAGQPTILVVYNHLSTPWALDQRHVCEALFGDIVFVETLRTDDGSYDTLDGQIATGGGRGVTPEHNTSLSAVAVLEFEADVLRLRVYHNPFAAVVLKPELLEPHRVEQRFRPGDESLAVND